MDSRVSRDGLAEFLQEDIYRAFGYYGRDVTAGDLAEFLAASMSVRYGITRLDPTPWVYYDRETILHRSTAWSEDHDAFLPRDGYEQDISKYPTMRENEPLSHDDAPWAAKQWSEGDNNLVVIARGRKCRDLDGYDVVCWEPRKGYLQERKKYKHA